MSNIIDTFCDEDWIPSGSTLPYVQVGMVIRHSCGGPRLVVVGIYGTQLPTAVCRSGIGADVSILCTRLRKHYRLAEPFTPNQ